MVGSTTVSSVVKITRTFALNIIDRVSDAGLWVSVNPTEACHLLNLSTASTSTLESPLDTANPAPDHF